MTNYKLALEGLQDARTQAVNGLNSFKQSDLSFNYNKEHMNKYVEMLTGIDSAIKMTRKLADGSLVCEDQ